jgi:hypothetical protein
MDRMPVPQPTSRTILSRNRCLFFIMEFMYARVRTSSFNISWSNAGGDTNMQCSTS